VTYLFSPKGIKFLKKICKNHQTLFAFDYDGTLAPYIPDLAGGKIKSDVAKNLSQLIKIRKVAVVSGRGVKGLKHMLGKIKPRYVVGNHGSEGVKIRGYFKAASKKLCKGWRLRISKEHIHGVVVEDKTFTLSLHYRNTRSSSKARLALLKVIDTLEPAPRVIFGKSVVNLLPRNAPNKGDGVRAVLDQSKLKKVLYFGDDLTDEDVFSLEDRRIYGVKVGRSASSKASYFIKRQTEINKVLIQLLNL